MSACNAVRICMCIEEFSIPHFMNFVQLITADAKTVGNCLQNTYSVTQSDLRNM